MSGGVAWKTVLDAIHSHFKTHTGLTTATAWGAQPEMPERAGPACMLRRPKNTKKIHGDDVIKKYDPTGASGQGDIRRYVTGQREFILHAEVYSDSVAHNTHAQTILQSAVDALNLPSAVSALKTANVAVVDVGDVIDLSEISGGNWRSRAGVDITFRTTSNQEDTRVIPIERIKGTLRLNRTPDDEDPIVLDIDTGDTTP